MARRLGILSASVSALVRAILVIAVGVWMLGTAIAGLERIWEPYPDNGIDLDFDGAVTDVAPRSPGSAAGIEVGDHVVPPLAPALFRDPPPSLTFKLNHHGTVRTVTLSPQNRMLSRVDRAIIALLFLEYSVFLVVGSLVLLLRPSAMTWSLSLLRAAPLRRPRLLLAGLERVLLGKLSHAGRTWEHRMRLRNDVRAAFSRAIGSKSGAVTR